MTFIEIIEWKKFLKYNKYIIYYVSRGGIILKKTQEKLNKRLKNAKGITLIALVITIVLNASAWS